LAVAKDCVKELQTETSPIGNKGDYQLGLDEWPPTLALSVWVAILFVPILRL
jgi:hypothetical protein